MNSIDAIKNNITMADMVCGAYLADMSDQDLMLRPHPGCNHLNWQVGHLISSDNHMANGCLPGSLPDLPEGFNDKYSKEAAGNDDASAFHSKEELMAISAKQREAIIVALEKLSEADLDKPSPESMQGYAPTVGAAFNMLGAHWLMHAGQWAVVRRQTDKPIVI